MAKKGQRIIIKLKSSSGHAFYTTKNRINTKDKLELKKYDPKLRKHVKYSEAKLK